MAFEEDVITKWVDAGIPTTQCFWAQMSAIPAGDGPWSHLTSTGGTRGQKVQDVPGEAWEEPSAQCVATAKTPSLARARAKVMRNALIIVRNIFINGTWYMNITADQPPFDFPVDALGRARCVFNIRAVKQPS